MATPDTVYGCSADTLTKFMQYRGREAVSHLTSMFGSSNGLCEKLRTSPTEGLSDPSDIERRKVVFGCNFIAPRPPKTFFALVFEAIQDTTLIILIAAAILSLVLPFVMPGKSNKVDTRSEWIEGVAIFVAVLVVVLVTAGNNYSKEKQFRGLQNSVKQEQRISVVRSGQSQQIPVIDLVVGDVCLIKYGDRVPADGVVLQCNDLKIDEASLTGETDLVRKGIDIDPCLLSTTQVMEGSGKILITAVGINSQTGTIMKLMGAAKREKSKSPSKSQKGKPSSSTANGNGTVPNGHYTDEVAVDQIEVCSIDSDSEKKEEADLNRKERSVLQAKLTHLATQIGYCGTVIALLTIAVLIIRFCIEKYVYDKMPFETSDLQEFIGFIIIGITVLVIAVPEGLPLAVTLALAYSVKKMMKDHNLVRHLYACETMGNATAICSDKTGTLTTNVMTVVQSYVGGILYKETPNWNELNENLRSILVRSISINSGYSSQVKQLSKEVGAQPKQIGNKTECALLGFVLGLGQNYQTFRDEVPEEKFVKVYTFNSARKSMSTVVEKRDDQGGYRLFCKGASEVVLKRCKFLLNQTGIAEPLNEAQQKHITRQIIDSMASKGLRTICVAYKDYVPSRPAMNQILYNDNNGVDWDAEDDLTKGLTCLAVVGIQDPVRSEVPAAILNCQQAGITVRMVTGDNVQTARSIAISCGIIKPTSDFLVLEGPEFNRRIRDASGQVQQELLDAIWPNLRVLARSSPTDKYNLVKGIIESKLSKHREVVAVTGDGTNDGPALKKADVGFAMGIAGTDVAKEASDIILTDDNFTSIVKAVMWGRNVYDSISKFLQFQLTVNVVAVLVAFIGACIIGDSPLKAIQMLWVNLIMDSLAALALATELPTKELLTRKPYGRKKAIINRTMSKNILGHALYQMVIMFTLLFVGHKIFDIDNGDDLHGLPSQHFTLVFNIFVVMTLFNMLNARKIHNERNVFERVFTNPVFCAIWLICFTVQVIVVEFGGLVFGTVSLTINMWMWCIFFGIGELLWAQLLATIPSKRLPKQMQVGRGVVQEIPLAGIQDLTHPCEDRSPRAMWHWSVGRINMKMQVIKAFQDTNSPQFDSSTRKSLGRVSYTKPATVPTKLQAISLAVLDQRQANINNSSSKLQNDFISTIKL